MPGATTSTSTIAATNSATSAISCFQEVPAKNRIANPTATYTSAVPRSGCGITISAGTSASSMIRAVVRRSCSRRERSTANADSDTISSTLPNSEGCSWKNGSGIQRAAPCTWGIPSTTRFSAIITPYRPYLYSRSRE